MSRHLLAALGIALALLTGLTAVSPSARAAEPVTGAGCAVQALAYQPRLSETAATFEQVGVGLLAAPYPRLPALRVGLPPQERMSAGVVPCLLLKAIGRLESDWRQSLSTTPEGAVGPALATSNCGYGLMQITWGMRRPGDLPGDAQQRIAGDYRFNALWGATMLANSWNSPAKTMPYAGDRDPNVIENWYYTVWAYHNWTSANNPNNPDLPWPRPTFTGPENRSNYPYQEMVWGLAANPPRRQGQPLWEPVVLSLPRREDVGLVPQPLPVFSESHRSVCAAPPPPPAATPQVWRVLLPWVTRSYHR